MSKYKALTQSEKHRLYVEKSVKPEDYSLKYHEAHLVECEQNAVEDRKLSLKLRELEREKRLCVSRIDGHKRQIRMTHQNIVYDKRSETDFNEAPGFRYHRNGDAKIDTGKKRKSSSSDISLKLTDSKALKKSSSNKLSQQSKSSSSTNGIYNIEDQIKDLEKQLNYLKVCKDLQNIYKKNKTIRPTLKFVKAHANDSEIHTGNLDTGRCNQIRNKGQNVPSPERFSRKNCKANCMACEYRFKFDADIKVDRRMSVPLKPWRAAPQGVFLKTNENISHTNSSPDFKRVNKTGSCDCKSKKDTHKSKSAGDNKHSCKKEPKSCSSGHNNINDQQTTTTITVNHAAGSHKIDLHLSTSLDISDSKHGTNKHKRGFYEERKKEMNFKKRNEHSKSAVKVPISYKTSSGNNDYFFKAVPIEDVKQQIESESQETRIKISAFIDSLPANQCNITSWYSSDGIRHNPSRDKHQQQDPVVQRDTGTAWTGYQDSEQLIQDPVSVQRDRDTAWTGHREPEQPNRGTAWAGYRDSEKPNRGTAWAGYRDSEQLLQDECLSPYSSRSRGVRSSLDHFHGSKNCFKLYSGTISAPCLPGDSSRNNDLANCRYLRINTREQIS